MMTRLTATERRDDVLDAAMIEFAERGYEGTSTEDIAHRAGISQPYLFRLFGTKKELFKASVARCFRETLELFQRAAEGERGEEALTAMGQAYVVQVAQRDEIVAGLRAQGIQCQIGTYALHRLGAYRSQGSFPGADAAFERALALPLHARLTDGELDRVADALDKLVSHH